MSVCVPVCTCVHKYLTHLTYNGKGGSKRKQRRKGKGKRGCEKGEGEEREGVRENQQPATN